MINNFCVSTKFFDPGYKKSPKFYPRYKHPISRLHSIALYKASARIPREILRKNWNMRFFRQNSDGYCGKKLTSRQDFWRDFCLFQFFRRISRGILAIHISRIYCSKILILMHKHFRYIAKKSTSQTEKQSTRRPRKCAKISDKSTFWVGFLSVYTVQQIFYR
jgi:hypothetical protein